MNQFDVVVVGGGIVGLSAAIAMTQRGVSVAVLDAGPFNVDTHQCDSRVYALNQTSIGLLEKLEVWPLLNKTRISPYQHMLIWDAKNDAKIEFDARDVGSNQLGVILEESILKDALLQQIKALGITLFPHCKVNRVVPASENTYIYDTSEQSWKTSLLMGTDGANSKVRELLGVPLTSWPYHQQAIVTTVHTEKPHQKTAYQIFNPDGPLAFLPLSEPNQCSIVWSTSERQASALMALDKEEFAFQLTQAFAAKLGNVTIQGPRYQFPLIMRHVKQYVGPHWLLMGDAAHTIHPLAGLGLNVGLADLNSWLNYYDMLKQTRALASYQRQRKHAVWQIIALMSGLKNLFGNPLSPIVSLRGFGLNACDHSPILKRLLIEQASMM